MRHERTRERAPGHRLHHRRFDFEKSPAAEELPKRRDNPAADLEYPP
jgi:hypothetical protein